MAAWRRDDRNGDDQELQGPFGVSLPRLPFGPGATRGRGQLSRKTDARDQWPVVFGVLASVVVAAVVLFAGSSWLYGTFTDAPTRGEIVFEQWYSKATEASKKAAALAKKTQLTLEQNMKEKPTMGPTVVPKSVLERIRGVAQTLDLFQQDIYDELWIGLGTYPGLLRGQVPLFRLYADQAFPYSNADPVSQSIRSSLDFDVKRFKKACDELEVGLGRRNIRDVERAYAELSISYDRYLKAGNLYEGYDPVTSTSVFYENIDDAQLVYTPLSLQQPLVRDEVLVIQGPDKGKVGQVIWLGRSGPGNKDPDKIVTATVKLTANPELGSGTGKGIKEVKTYPYAWIAVTRTTDQNFVLDIFLAGLAALFSCAITYPLDSMKARAQSGLPLLPEEGPTGLFQGLTFNLCREIPNQALYLAGFNYLTRYFCQLPFVNSNDPNLKLLVMIPAGVLGFLSGSPFRAPFEVLNRQVQTGMAKTNEEAIENVFYKPPQAVVVKNLYSAWLLCVFKGVPFGALQCTLYEFFKDRLELAQYGVPISAMPFIWGTAAGFLTGIITNPPDMVLAKVTEMEAEKIKGNANPKLSTDQGPAVIDVPGMETDSTEKNRHAAAVTDDHVIGGADPVKDSEQTDEDGESVSDQLANAIAKINEEDGPAGYFKGAPERAIYFAPEACLWFAAYEYLRSFVNLVSDA